MRKLRVVPAAPFLLLSAACVAAPRISAQEPQAPDPPTLESLQRRIEELEAAQARVPTVATGTDSTIELFGRIHLDVWTFPYTAAGIDVLENGDPADDPGSNFQFRRARLGMAGKVFDEIVYKFEIDFGHPDEFAFKDLYFGWEDLPVVQTLLIGNQKRPYGLDALNSSNANVFMERPFTNDLTTPDARRFGIASYGHSEDLLWNWRWGAYDQVDLARIGDVRTDRIQPELAARLAATPWYDEESGGRYYAHTAVSASIGWPNGEPMPGDSDNQARYASRPEARSDSRWIDTGAIAMAEQQYLVGAEGALNLDRLQLVGEYQGVWVDRGSLESVFLHGGYVYVAYFLTDGFMPWSRARGTVGAAKADFGGAGAFQIAARYSYADYSTEDVLGGVGHAVTLGFNWYWSRRASMQVNYVRGEISDRMVMDGNGAVFDGGDYDIVGIRFRVNF